jgi:hypothetical protein
MWGRQDKSSVQESPTQPTLEFGRERLADVRPLVFTTPMVEIRLEPLHHSWDERMDLLGRVLPRNPRQNLGTLSVRLFRGDLEVARTATDELGEFVLEGIDPGTYRLTLHTDALGFELPVVPLLPRRDASSGAPP